MIKNDCKDANWLYFGTTSNEKKPNQEIYYFLCLSVFSFKYSCLELNSAQDMVNIFKFQREPLLKTNRITVDRDKLYNTKPMNSGFFAETAQAK